MQFSVNKVFLLHALDAIQMVNVLFDALLSFEC